jgi:hypothetical protein
VRRTLWREPDYPSGLRRFDSDPAASHGSAPSSLQDGAAGEARASCTAWPGPMAVPPGKAAACRVQVAALDDPRRHRGYAFDRVMTARAALLR